MPDGWQFRTWLQLTRGDQPLDLRPELFENRHGRPGVEIDSTLIPQRSIRRNLFLAATAVLLLAGVWASPHVLRPSVVENNSGGGWTPFARAHQVLTQVQLTPEGWPNVGVQSVGDLPGAKVAGAWVVPDALAVPPPTTHPAEYATGLDYLRASLPHGSLDSASRLPQRLVRGEPAQLFVLWNITDCSRLVEDRRPQIELTSVLGTRSHQQLPDWSAPGFDVGTLTKSGTCPKP